MRSTTRSSVEWVGGHGDGTVSLLGSYVVLFLSCMVRVDLLQSMKGTVPFHKTFIFPTFEPQNYAVAVVFKCAMCFIKMLMTLNYLQLVTVT